MRKFFSLSAALGGAISLLGLGASASAQELLTNGSLDATSVSSQVLATPTSWDVVASRTIAGPFNDGCSSEGFPQFPADPTGKGLFFKPFTGSVTNGPVTVDMSQTVAGNAGTPYLLRGFAGAEANYVGLSDPTVGSVFHMDFLNGANAVLGSAILDLKAAGLGTPNGNPFGYAQYSLSATAPAGTAFVRVGVSMQNAFGNPLGGGQAYVADTFSLRAVPEPTSLALVGLGSIALLKRRRNA